MYCKSNAVSNDQNTVYKYDIIILKQRKTLHQRKLINRMTEFCHHASSETFAKRYPGKQKDLVSSNAILNFFLQVQTQGGRYARSC